MLNSFDAVFGGKEVNISYIEPSKIDLTGSADRDVKYLKYERMTSVSLTEQSASVDTDCITIRENGGHFEHQI